MSQRQGILICIRKGDKDKTLLRIGDQYHFLMYLIKSHLPQKQIGLKSSASIDK